MKKTTTKIGLYNRSILISYYDLTTSSGGDSCVFFFDCDAATVADFYAMIIEDDKKNLEDDDHTITGSGIYSRADNDIAYISYEETKEDFEGSTTVEHDVLVSVYADVDGEWVLIPYSDEPVTAVTIDDYWDI